MPEPRVTTYETRFPRLKVRHYANVSRVGVPGHRKPFSDSWWRFVAFDECGPIDGVDVGASYRTKAEIYARLTDYAAENGYTEDS